MQNTKQQPILTCPATRITPIIKVVGEECNIQCDYCYYRDAHRHSIQQKIMSDDILETFISQYLSLFKGQVDFLWHGGEPLLASINFYKKVIYFQNKYATNEHQISNAIQTNGLLVNAEWANFFHENQFHIGISLDGQKNIHDRFRKDKEGNGTFERVINSINLMRRYGIEPKILQVVTKSSLPDIAHNFLYFVNDLNIKNWGINVFCDIEKSNPRMLKESLSNDDYYILYRTIFDLWIKQNDPNLVIREIDDFVAGVLGKRIATCSMSGNCTSFMTVDCDGTIVPFCDNLLSQGRRFGGNISNTTLCDILKNEKRINFAAKINEFPSSCKKCEWFFACFNGCSYHRYGGIDGKYIYCSGQKKVFTYIKEQLKRIELF